MKEIKISEFKAHCIAIINEVNRNRSPVVITRRGKPVARLNPYQTNEVKRKFGDIGKMHIHGDIVGADSTDDWEINT